MALFKKKLKKQKKIEEEKKEDKNDIQLEDDLDLSLDEDVDLPTIGEEDEETNENNTKKKLSIEEILKEEEDPLMGELLDEYSVSVDDATFDVQIRKASGITYYIIKDIEDLKNVMSKFTDENISDIKSGLSGKIFESVKDVKDFLTNYCSDNHIPIKRHELDLLSKHFYLSIGKLGIIEVPIHDSNLEELMVNGTTAPTYVAHRKYDACETNIRLDNSELMRIVEGIAMLANRNIDSRTPMLDAFLPDGSRVNATTPDVTLNGVTITIRKFSEDPLTIVDLIKFGTFTVELAAFLWQAVEGYFGTKPANTLIAGGTGSGKTTTLNVVSLFSMYTDRIITVEDTPELQIPHKHVIKMLTRPPRPGVEGYEITMDDLIKNTLRMRPDRIFVGEVRGPEARSLLTAMNTGHDGCSGTLHANSADEAITRLINPPMSVPKIMITALDFIINQQRIKRNRKTIRRILSIMEIGGSGENITKTELYKYDGDEDTIHKTGICMWEEEVCRIAGIDRSELMEDRERRERVIKYMVDNNINGIKNVGKIIRKYQENPDELMKIIGQ